MPAWERFAFAVPD